MRSRSLDGIEQKFLTVLLFAFFFGSITVAELKESRADRCLIAHHDALTHAQYVILLALDRTVIQMVSGHLE